MLAELVVAVVAADFDVRGTVQLVWRSPKVECFLQIQLSGAAALTLFSHSFDTQVLPGAHLTFQIAVVNVAVAGATPLQVSDVAFSDFSSSSERDGRTQITVIPGAMFRCMNLQGVDFWGRNVSFVPSQIGAADGVLPLWVAGVVPGSIVPGNYTGKVTVTFAQSGTCKLQTASVHVALTVLPGPPVPHGGDDDISTGALGHLLCDCMLVCFLSAIC